MRKPSELKAIVTGGASGLGEGTAREIIAQGGQVALLDMNAEAGQALAAELGENAIFCQTDVTDEAQVAAALQAATDAFGGVNALVNCAGIVIGQKITSRGEPHPLDK